MIKNMYDRRGCLCAAMFTFYINNTFTYLCVQRFFLLLIFDLYRREEITHTTSSCYSKHKTLKRVLHIDKNVFYITIQQYNE